MSSRAFDLLRSNHTSDVDSLDRFESVVESVLRGDPSAVLDEANLAGPARLSEDTVYEYLVELSAVGALMTRLFWVCPITRGTTAEADTLSEFASLRECDKCGEMHEFRARDIQVHFLASDELIRAARDL